VASSQARVEPDPARTAPEVERLIEQIKTGDARERVIAVLGRPTRASEVLSKSPKTRDADYYSYRLSEDEGPNGVCPMIVVYFDRNGRVRSIKRVGPF